MSSATSNTDKFPALTSAQTCHHFSLAEIRDATNDFDENKVIGHGGFGKVYRGQLCSKEGNHIVAIKRLDLMSNQGEPEFMAELQMLSQLCHRHLVSLIGFCDDNKEMILVYKYMSNGTLNHHLHKATTPLSWIQRLKIAIGAGHGLSYLHTGVGTEQEIIHRDVKSSNILLDENWEAMISDFGLSKMRPTNQSLSYLDASVKGTFGYLDPEYYYTGKLTTKTDVYAFGVVLFELLSGRLAVDTRNGEDQCSLVRWAQKCIKDRKLDQMVDINIRGTITKRCLGGFTKIADRCVCSVTKKRPSMTEVVALLQDLLEQQEKADMSAMLPGRMGFPSKILKYLVPEIKPNSEQRHKSIQKNLEDTNQRSIDNKDGSCHGEMLQQHRELVARKVEQFAYGELEDATGHFGWHRTLGFGFNGTVYRGWLNNKKDSTSNNTGSPIAVRNLDGYKHFDLQMYKEFQHPNLVQLIGYCICGRDLYLVYEYMCNGNFEDLLRCGTIARLPLVTRIKIVVGIARGMVFLNEAQFRLKKMTKTHRGSLIARNKLLFDEDFNVKISGYEFPMLVHGFFTHRSDMDTLPSNLRGFKKLFKEVVVGEKVTYFSLSRSSNKSLSCIASSCFQICNEGDAESKILTIMDKYKKHFREWGIPESNYGTRSIGIKHRDLRQRDIEMDKQNSIGSCIMILVCFILILVGFIVIWLVCKSVLLVFYFFKWILGVGKLAKMSFSLILDTDILYIIIINIMFIFH